MQHLTQQLKSGDMEVRELPLPQVGSGMLQVRNHYSLISAGTEGATVKTARKSLVGKAKERPQQVKQVVDALKQQGPVQTYRAVMKKLSAYSPLGYSCAGVVMDAGDGVTGFQVGDRVACAGAGYANHAEVVSVPENLCVKVPEKADLRLAAFNTLGAIAMQGVRQADLRLGEACGVIGLGLLGQITGKLLRAAGIKVFGIDIDSKAVETASEKCVDYAYLRSDASLEDSILEKTNGIGLDAVIITAATDSLDPINFAGGVARKKGKVIVVGDIPTGFNRAPDWYGKELDLRMSCSYGPGRYDPDYEEHGIDYPVGYVRWTEKRNMGAFQELVHTKRIDLEHLVTHEFDLNDAAKAYDMILGGEEHYLGVLLKYDKSREIQSGSIQLKVPSGIRQEQIGVAFIGAGSYAQGNLLPNLPRAEWLRLINIMTNSGTTARRVADQYSFEACTDQSADIFENKDINTVFIATRHDSHADYVGKALDHNKNVFVEKPLAINREELDALEDKYGNLAKSGCAPLLMVGFNRRFSPLSVELANRLGDSPISMIYRVNAGEIPPESWIQDPKVGGGRIIGEVCHFVDYAVFLARSLPKRVYASKIPDPFGNNDTVAVNLECQNGSIASILYFSNGNKALPKEYIEVYQAGACAVLDNFRELKHFGNKKAKKRLSVQDKGQRQMMKSFFSSLKDGEKASISVNELFAVHHATFGAIESLRTGQPVDL